MDQPKLISRIFSRLLHSMFLITRGMTLGVRAVVSSEDGQFLLVRHTYTPGWHFPGGGVERNQTPQQALASELAQETGLEILEPPILHGIFFNRAVSKRDYVLVYLCQTKETMLAKPSSPEIAELDFFGVGDLPNDIDPGTARRIAEVVGAKTNSECW